MASRRIPANIVYRLAEKKDSGKILDYLLKWFTIDEPCCRALKMKLPVMTELYGTTVERCVANPFSTVVEKDGEIIGTLLASVYNRSDPIEEADFKVSDYPENVKLFVQFLNKSHRNFWDLAPKDVDTVLHREIASVAKPMMRSGIASGFVTTQMTKERLEKYNVGGCMSNTTSLANQKLQEKYKWKTLLAIPYSDLVDANGKQVLKLDDGSTHIKLNYKSIKDYDNLPD